MTPETIIERVGRDGVRLVLSNAETIKATGSQKAVVHPVAVSDSGLSLTTMEPFDGLKLTHCAPAKRF